MAHVEMINPDKPLTLAGHKTIISTDSVFTDLAKSMGDERLQMVSEPISDIITLSPDETRAFLQMVIASPQRILFDQNLQGLAQTADGFPLLSGWMKLSEFAGFVASLDDSPLSTRLNSLVSSWGELGAEEVFFDGFDIRYTPPGFN
jgi:hypothetical protein